MQGPADTGNSVHEQINQQSNSGVSCRQNLRTERLRQTQELLMAFWAFARIAAAGEVVPLEPLAAELALRAPMSSQHPVLSDGGPEQEELTPQQLCLVLWACGRLLCSPGICGLDRLFTAAEACVEQLTAQDVVRCAPQLQRKSSTLVRHQFRIHDMSCAENLQGTLGSSTLPTPEPNLPGSRRRKARALQTSVKPGHGCCDGMGARCG